MVGAVPYHATPVTTVCHRGAGGRRAALWKARLPQLPAAASGKASPGAQSPRL